MLKCPNMLDFGKGPVVVLFYDGYECKAIPGRLGALYSNTRESLRATYRRMKGLQVETGFYVAFKLLVESLRRKGCDVRINDFALAAANPHYPIGLSGYSSVLQKVQLQNPTIFGPGDYGYPNEAEPLKHAQHMRKLIQPSEWAAALYRSRLGEKMMVWPVGIDTDACPDLSHHTKDLDFVIYDKIRWNRDTEVPRVLERIVKHIEVAGQSYKVLRYGAHHYRDYMECLKRARAMLFVCEHETQGLACQEALSSNVPVLAWDEGVLVDPLQRRFLPDGMRVSSVPYFDARCGETFELENFEETYDVFVSRLASYQPRQFVLEELSMDASASAYLKAYASLT